MNHAGSHKIEQPQESPMSNPIIREDLWHSIILLGLLAASALDALKF